MTSIAVMGTLVTIQVVDRGSTREQLVERDAAIERAFEWFRHVEACCSRFDPRSELMQLTAQPGVSVPVSEMLYEAVRFALAVAEQTGGAFDPTVGRRMESHGFNRDYRTGQIIETALETDEGVDRGPQGPRRAVSYRDVHLDADRKTIALGRPLVLDLGAVAKGMAIDMAARELYRFNDYAIDAGGDLFLAGSGPNGGPWSVGIRHPRLDDRLVDTVSLSNAAVCTSGDYERRSPATNGCHIIDPRAGTPANAVASATVIAPNAMLADALATAAFVLGPVEGLDLLARQGVDGLIVSPTLERYTTKGWRGALGRCDGTPASAR